MGGAKGLVKRRRQMQGALAQTRSGTAAPSQCGSDLGNDGERDFGRCVRPNVEPDRTVDARMQGIVDNRPLGCSLVEQAKRAVPWSEQSDVAWAHRDDGLKGGDVEREVVAHQQHDRVAIRLELCDRVSGRAQMYHIGSGKRWRCRNHRYVPRPPLQPSFYRTRPGARRHDRRRTPCSGG
jgi:hypothetical protein